MLNRSSAQPPKDDSGHTPGLAAKSKEGREKEEVATAITPPPKSQHQESQRGKKVESDPWEVHGDQLAGRW